MVKTVVVALGVIGVTALLAPAPVSAGVCFKDQFNRTYDLEVAGQFGQAAHLFATLALPSPFPGTVFLTGGAYLNSSGKAGVNLTSVGSGFTMTLDPPSFTSGVGTQFSYSVLSPGSMTGLTLTPASCLSSLP